MMDLLDFSELQVVSVLPDYPVVWLILSDTKKTVVFAVCLRAILHIRCVNEFSLSHLC